MSGSQDLNKTVTVDATEAIETPKSEEPFIIDLHSHFLPPNLPDFSTRYGYNGFVSLEVNSTTKSVLKKGKKVLFEVPQSFWDIDARYEYLVSKKINLQVLSPPSSIFSYWAKADDTADLCRILNNSLLKETEKYPSKFIPLCILPLQAIELALIELERCKNLGFKGCLIGTSINEFNLDSPELFPFYEFCEENNFSIFVHSISNQEIQRKDRKYWLTSLLGNIKNINRSILTFILGNVLENFPKLKILFFDGGGSFPYLLGNFEQSFYLKNEVKKNTEISPKSQIKQKKIFFDTNICSKESLELMVKVIGAENILYGSNYPFIPSAVLMKETEEMGEEDERGERRESEEGSREFVEEDSFREYLLKADNVTKEKEKKILGENAIRFLNLTEEEVAKARYPSENDNIVQKLGSS